MNSIQKNMKTSIIPHRKTSIIPHGVLVQSNYFNIIIIIYIDLIPFDKYLNLF